VVSVTAVVTTGGGKGGEDDKRSAEPWSRGDVHTASLGGSLSHSSRSPSPKPLAAA